MHIVFIPYGKRDMLEKMLRCMESQPGLMTFRKDTETKQVIMEPQVRLLPFGIYEYICPKESMDRVLVTLGFHKNKYILSNFESIIGAIKLAFLRKLAQCEPIPDFNIKAQPYCWFGQEFVNILPLGIRYDNNVTEIEGQFKGYTHEAI